MYSIFKTFVLSLLMIAQVHFAYAQNAAILPPAKTTFTTPDGKPLTAGTVDFYVPGTTTRKTTWQDGAATIPNTNPVVLDGSGRALILGNGAYRQVVKDRNGNLIWDQVTNSAGAGGSGQSTVGDGLSVGTILPWSGFVAPSNYAFAYGQELNRTTYSSLFDKITLLQDITCVSGNATITTIADTSQLNVGGAVEAACLPAASVIVSKTSNTVTLNNLALVSTTTSGRFFPWGGGNGLTTFNIPDLRGVYMPGRNNMGGASSSNLTSSFYTDPNSIAGLGGSQSRTLLSSNLPSYTPTGTVTSTLIDGGAVFYGFTTPGTNVGFGGTATGGNQASAVSELTISSPFVGNSINGGIAGNASVAAGGSGYSNGTQLLTVTGGTCTTQPQYNVTGVAGAITSPVIVTAGDCSVVPANPVSTTGGGGTGGTLNILWFARPISVIPPSKTVNYIIKVLPDVSLTVATCGNLTDAGTACTANTGTSGHTLPFLDGANSWSGVQTLVNAPIFSSLTGYLKGNGASALTASATIPATDLSGTIAAARMPALTGDVTSTVNTVATTIAANAVTNAKMATMAANTIKANATAGVATPTDVDISTLTTKASPAAGDFLLLSDQAASGALKKATVSSVGTASGVSSIAGNTGAFTLTTGITNSTNAIRLSLTNTTLQAQPANPSSTTSATGVMMGLGTTCTLTPSYSGRIKVDFIGAVNNNASNNSIAIRLQYGTGAAPSNGTAISGTQLASTLAINQNNASNNAPFTQGGIITGLSPGTAYWFDLTLSASANTSTMVNVSCNAMEF